MPRDGRWACAQASPACRAARGVARVREQVCACAMSAEGLSTQGASVGERGAVGDGNEGRTCTTGPLPARDVRRTSDGSAVDRVCELFDVCAHGDLLAGCASRGGTSPAKSAHHARRYIRGQPKGEAPDSPRRRGRSASGDGQGSSNRSTGASIAPKSSVCTTTRPASPIRPGVTSTSFTRTASADPRSSIHMSASHERPRDSSASSASSQSTASDAACPSRSTATQSSPSGRIHPRSSPSSRR